MLYKKRALRVFAKNYREVFEWEFESLPMGGSQRCQDCCQSLTHYCRAPAPTCGENLQTFWQTRSHLPPISIFVANTSLNDAVLFSFAFFSAAWTFGRWQRRFWDNWPILWMITPPTGRRPIIAVSPFAAVLLLVVLLVLVDVVVVVVVVAQMRIKSLWEQWGCLLPGTDWWTASPVFSSPLCPLLNHFTPTLSDLMGFYIGGATWYLFINFLAIQ